MWKIRLFKHTKQNTALTWHLPSMHMSRLPGLQRVPSWTFGASCTTMGSSCVRGSPAGRPRQVSAQGSLSSWCAVHVSTSPSYGTSLYAAHCCSRNSPDSGHGCNTHNRQLFFFFYSLTRSSRQIFIRVGRTNSSYLAGGCGENYHVLESTPYPQN